jgi:hypothetical protein
MIDLTATAKSTSRMSSSSTESASPPRKRPRTQGSTHGAVPSSSTVSHGQRHGHGYGDNRGGGGGHRGGRGSGGIMAAMRVVGGGAGTRNRQELADWADAHPGLGGVTGESSRADIEASTANALRGGEVGGVGGVGGGGSREHREPETTYKGGASPPPRLPDSPPQEDSGESTNNKGPHSK